MYNTLRTLEYKEMTKKIIKICPICKRKFRCYKRQITCGKACSAKWRSKTMKGVVKHRPFHKKEVICPVCEDLFIPKRRGSITCSAICGHKLQSCKISGKNNGNYNVDLDNTKNILCKKHNINMVRFSYNEKFNKKHFFKKLKLWYSPIPKETWENKKW